MDDPAAIAVRVFVASLLLSTRIHAESIKYECSLKYEENVSSKPDMFVTTYFSPGFCGIGRGDNSSTTKYTLGRWETVGGGLAYDAARGALWFSSESSGLPRRARLNRLRLADRHLERLPGQFEVASVAGLHSGQGILDLAYDWVSGNMYVNLRESIRAVSVDAAGWGSRELVANLSLVTSFAVHPNRACLFFADGRLDYEASRRKPNGLYRARLDGSGLRPIRQRLLGDLRGFENLAVDFHAERLYWSVTLGEQIESSDLEGGEVRSVAGLQPHRGQPYLSSHMIAVDRGHVYYPAAGSRLLRRFRKADQLPDEDFRLLNARDTEIAGILVYDPDSQTTRPGHPCARGASPCAKFCFALPAGEDDRELVASCACSDGERLAEDRRSCEASSHV